MLKAKELGMKTLLVLSGKISDTKGLDTDLLDGVYPSVFEFLKDIYRPERERAIINRLKNANLGLLDQNAIEAIYQEIFAVSRNLEMPQTIAYLGISKMFLKS